MVVRVSVLPKNLHGCLCCMVCVGCIADKIPGHHRRGRLCIPDFPRIVRVIVCIRGQRHPRNVIPESIHSVEVIQIILPVSTPPHSQSSCGRIKAFFKFKDPVLFYIVRVKHEHFGVEVISSFVVSEVFSDDFPGVARCQTVVHCVVCIHG